nr:hypothetical protein Itr_chr03CG10580 [Ipomoea trifida]
MAEPAAVAIWRTSGRASGRSISYRRWRGNPPPSTKARHPVVALSPKTRRKTRRHRNSYSGDCHCCSSMPPLDASQL